jgi:hypothetical protein
MPLEVNIESLRNANRIFLFISVILLLIFLSFGILALTILMSLTNQSMILTLTMYLFKILRIVIISNMHLLGILTVMDYLGMSP